MFPSYDLSNECEDQMIKPSMYEDIETINFLANWLSDFLKPQNMRLYGGFRSHGGTPLHHPFSNKFSMNFPYKPSSYWGIPHSRNQKGWTHRAPCGVLPTEMMIGRAAAGKAWSYDAIASISCCLRRPWPRLPPLRPLLILGACDCQCDRMRRPSMAATRLAHGT